MSSILTGGSTIAAGSHSLLTAILTAIPFRQAYAHLMADARYQVAAAAMGELGKLLALGEVDPAAQPALEG